MGELSENERMLLNQLRVVEEAASLDEFRKLVGELVRCMEEFRQTSTRLLEIMHGYIPVGATKKGLSAYILNLLRYEYRMGVPKITARVMENYAYRDTLSNRAIKDSVRYLENKGSIKKIDNEHYSIR